MAPRWWRSRLRSPQHTASGDLLVPVPSQTTRPDTSQGSVMAPVPTRSEAISLGPEYRLNHAKAGEDIKGIHHFRILVMGRANAGKTTILQRVCYTTDQPEIFDGKGDKVDTTVVQGSMIRGYHDIENALFFKSNPNFVFHDSCGFEAGSEAQFDKVKDFVMDRARATNLNERIHAIWYCIPLSDRHRMVTGSEKRFFDACDTGHVPVIVLLTKADVLELDAHQELDDEDLWDGRLGVDDAMKRVAEVKEKILTDIFARVKEVLSAMRFPPCGYMALSGMEQEGADCTELLKCTANALSEEALQKLLISTQQSAVALCIEFAVMKALKLYMTNKSGHVPPGELSLGLLIWFPFVDKPHGYWRQLLWLWQEELHQLDNIDKNLMPAVRFQSQALQMPALSTSVQHTMRYIAEHGIGSILVFDYLSFLMQVEEDQQDFQRFLTMAVEEYQTSGVQARVNKLVAVAFQHHGDNAEALCPVLVDIAKENQMSKKLLK